MKGKGIVSQPMVPVDPSMCPAPHRNAPSAWGAGGGTGTAGVAGTAGAAGATGAAGAAGVAGGLGAVALAAGTAGGVGTAGAVCAASPPRSKLLLFSACLWCVWELERSINVCFRALLPGLVD